MVHTRTQFIAGISGAVLLCSVGAFAGLQFMVGAHKETLAAHLSAAAEMQARQRATAELNQSLSDTLAQRQELDSRIVSDGQVIDFLSLIEQVGREQGVDLITSSLTERPFNERYEMLEVVFEATGPYESVLRVLRLLETLPYQSTVQRVHMIGEEEARGGDWIATVMVQVTKFNE